MSKGQKRRFGVVAFFKVFQGPSQAKYNQAIGPRLRLFYFCPVLGDEFLSAHIFHIRHQTHRHILICIDTRSCLAVPSLLSILPAY
jgi:hypothetical protein